MANVSLVDGHIDQEEYIVDYEDRHFESFWNEDCELWSVYQAKLQENGKYELEVHFLDNKPIATVEDAKERVEFWLKFKEVVLDEVKSEVGAE
jgi:hypothetical protein